MNSRKKKKVCIVIPYSAPHHTFWLCILTQRFIDVHVVSVVVIASIETAFEKQLKEEEKILESVAEKTALMGVAELAKGIAYTEPIKTGLAELMHNNVILYLFVY